MLISTIEKKLSLFGIIGFGASGIISSVADMLLKFLDSYNDIANLYMVSFLCNALAVASLLVCLVGYFLRWLRGRESNVLSFTVVALVGLLFMTLKLCIPLDNKFAGLYSNFAYEYHLSTIHCLYDSFLYSMATYFSPLIICALMLIMSMRYSNTKRWIFISLAAFAVLKTLIAALTSSGKLLFMETTLALVLIIVVELASAALLAYSEYIRVDEIELNDADFDENTDSDTEVAED